VFDVLDDRQDLVFEKEPMQSLVAQKELSVYQHDGFWQCMDTYRDWELLNQMFASGKAPWVR
jgi:glucose-1-phosphate cytidylyltransferase